MEISRDVDDYASVQRRGITVSLQLMLIVDFLASAGHQSCKVML